MSFCCGESMILVSDEITYWRCDVCGKTVRYVNKTANGNDPYYPNTPSSADINGDYGPGSGG